MAGKTDEVIERGVTRGVCAAADRALRADPGGFFRTQ